MIRSMTGYAQAQQIVGGKDILVEIKSVNHRFFDFSFRSSRMFSFLEGDFQKYMQAAISRGKVDVSVTIDILEDVQIEIRLNEDLLRGYVGALKSIAAKYELPDDVSVGTLTRFSDIFNVKRQQLDTDEIWQCVRQVADQALAGFSPCASRKGKNSRRI